MADAARDYEKLFGQKEIAARRSLKASVEFAAEVLSAARLVDQQKDLQSLLLEKAYDYGMRTAAGYPTAMAAMEMMIARMPDKKIEASEKLLEVHKRRYSFYRSSADKRKAIGEQITDLLVTLADEKARADQEPQALVLYRQALTYAKAWKPQRVDEIGGKIKRLRAAQESERRIDALKARLAEDPMNTRAREALITAHLGELDDAAEAVKLLTVDVDEGFRTYVPLVAKDMEDLKEAACKQLAEWLLIVAGDSPASDKGPLLAKARSYCLRYLELHTTKDVGILAGKMLLQKIEKAMPPGYVAKPPSTVVRRRPKLNTDPNQQLPDPDGQAAAMDKPVKVFIMMGEVSMLGCGAVEPESRRGTLQYLVKKENKYPHLVDDQGKWTQRADVRYVQVVPKQSGMSVVRNEFLTVQGDRIGVELQFGHIMGHVLDEPVLLLKSCTGNRSLGWDLLPPGSKRYEFAGRIYAGYRDSPMSWAKGTTPVRIGWYAGKQYDQDVANAKKVLAAIGRCYPGATKHEIAGFVWWQGLKDRMPAAHVSRYEQNLVHLIKTLRKDFGAPDAKFVLATIGFDGWRMAGSKLRIAQAQLAVSGDKGKYPEFKGNVKAVEARDFWRAGGVFPNSPYGHYFEQAETYMEVGNLLGWAMADLLVGND